MGRRKVLVCARGHLRTPENTSTSRGCTSCKICKSAREANLTMYQKRRKNQKCVEWAKRNGKRIAQRKQEIKREALTHYGADGELRCAGENCQIVDLDILTLDHILNNGCQERKLRPWAGKGHHLYSRLRRAGYPEGYQTLCANHQLKKEILRLREKVKSNG